MTGRSCSRTPTAVATTSPNTRLKRFAHWRGRPRRSWRVRSDSACSATSGGWSAAADTTSASTSMSPAHFANDTASAVVDTIAGPARVHRRGPRRPPPINRPIKRWIRSHFGQQLNTLGLPGDVARTTTRRRCDARRCSTLVGITGNDPDVQKRSRELVEQYLEGSRARCRRRWRQPCFTVAAIGGDRALYDRVRRQARHARRAARGVLPLLNALPGSRIRLLSSARSTTRSHRRFARRTRAPSWAT